LALAVDGRINIKKLTLVNFNFESFKTFRQQPTANKKNLPQRRFFYKGQKGGPSETGFELVISGIGNKVDN